MIRADEVRYKMKMKRQAWLEERLEDIEEKVKHAAEDGRYSVDVDMGNYRTEIATHLRNLVYKVSLNEPVDWGEPCIVNFVDEPDTISWEE